MSAPRLHPRREERASILLVDADASLRTIASLHLSPAGLRLVEAAGDAEALELARGDGVAAIVARVDGPRVDARGLLERLRAADEPGASAVPVLLVSANGSPELAALCARLPPARVLAAPVTGPRLVATLEALLKR